MLRRAVGRAGAERNAAGRRAQGSQEGQEPRTHAGGQTAGSTVGRGMDSAMDAGGAGIGATHAGGGWTWCAVRTCRVFKVPDPDSETVRLQDVSLVSPIVAAVTCKSFRKAWCPKLQETCALAPRDGHRRPCNRATEDI